jgi:hypothetical protein
VIDLSHITPMGFRYPLQHREPAAGFAARLAVLNGRRMNEFLRDMLIPPRSIDKGEDEAVRTLAAVGGVDGDDLVRYSPHPHLTQDDFHVVAGETLGYRRIFRNFFRFCPHCVAEDLATFEGPEVARPWLRLEWTLAAIRSCRTHDVYLTVTSPIRRRFEPFDFAETMETHLPNLERLKAESEHAPPFQFQEWVMERVDGLRDASDWLDRFPLYVGIEWCESLGLSILQPSKVKVETLTPAEWAEAAEAGFKVASKGTEAIRELLATFNDAELDTRGFWGPRDTYGYAYGMLQRTMKDPEFEPIRELVRDFAIDTLPIEPGTDVLGTVVDKPRVMTIRTAGRMSGASDRSIRTLFERHGLAKEALAKGLRNHRVTVRTADVEDMLQKLKGALTAPQVMEQLKIPRNHLAALIEIGALKTVTGSENFRDAKHRFAQSDIDDMIRRLLDGAEMVQEIGPRQMSVIDARKVATTSLEHVLSMVFEGKLKWKGRRVGRTDYDALLIDADEVIALVRSEPKGTGVIRTDIPGLIPGLHQKAVTAMIEEGMFEIDFQFSPDARRDVEVVTAESIEAFRRTYVTLGELMKMSGLHLKRIQALLIRVGIDVCEDPNVVVAWLYDRKRVEAILAAHPGFWGYSNEKAAAIDIN